MFAGHGHGFVVYAHKEYAHARTDDRMGTKDWLANSGSALMETSAVRRPPRRLCEISLTASYCSDLEPSEGDGGTPPDAGLLLYGFGQRRHWVRVGECAQVLVSTQRQTRAPYAHHCKCRFAHARGRKCGSRVAPAERAISDVPALARVIRRGSQSAKAVQSSSRGAWRAVGCGRGRW